MPYTIDNNYTGNGSTRLYSFTFPYLEDTDIKVTLNEVATTNFELANATQINFTADAGGETTTQAASGAPKSSIAVRIYRDTNIDNLQGEFFAGSAIRAQDLNNDFNQTLYVAQETQDKVVAIWDDTEETLSSSESFIDSDNYIMTAAAIDDRINANQAAHALTNGRIWVGNGSNVGAQVTPSGDITMANTGAFTIANTSVETSMIANDAINGTKLADNAVDTEHLASNAVTTPKITNATITGAKIAANTIAGSNMLSNAVGQQQLADNAVDTASIINDAVTSAKIADGAVVTAALADDGVTDAKLADNAVVTSVIAAQAVTTTRIANDAIGAGQIADNAIDSEHYTDGSIDTAHIADANVTLGKIENVSSTQVIVGNGSNRPTAVAMSGDIAIATNGATTIQANAVEIGMIGCEQTTISDSDSYVPTSGAVVDYVAAQIGPIGGLEVIANKDSFPETQPASGVVISVADAGGIVVNGSGTSTTPDTISSDATVTINNINSQFNSTTVTNGVSFMVTSTGSGQIYNFHKATLRTEDILAISTDIDDFANRYRVGANRTANNHASNDDGDLWFDTGSNKMYVYSGDPASGGEWQEVAAAGDFKLLTVKDHDQASGGSGPTFNGSNEEFDLFDGSADASITNIGQLLVSLNGVIQKPNTGTFSGSAEGFYLNDTHGIKFCDPPASGSSLFVTQIGAAVSLNEPADDSVSAVKIQTGAVTHVKLAADCVDGDNIQDDVINSEHIAAGAVDLEHMSSQSVDEDNLHISNAGSNGQYLQKQTGNSGGLTWATVDTSTLMPLAGGTITGDVVFDNATNAGNDLTWDMSDNALEFDDNVKATFGDGADLALYHNGSINKFESESHRLIISGAADQNVDIMKTQSEYMAKFIPDGAVELYNNNVLRCEVKSTGLEVNGGQIQLKGIEGGEAQLQLIADEGDDNDDNWRIMAGTTNYLQIGNSASGGWETNIKCIGNGTVELYYDNARRLYTESNGVYIDSDEGGEAYLSYKADEGDDNADFWRTGASTNADFYLQNFADASWETNIKAIGGGAVELYHNNTKSFSTTAAGLAFNDVTDSQEIWFSDSNDADAGKILYDHTDDSMRFHVWGSEAVRIRSNGIFQASTNTGDSDGWGNDYHVLHSNESTIACQIENSHDSGPYGLKIDFSDDDPDNNDNYFMRCQDSSASRFYIYSDGDGWNHDHSWSSSDGTLKENIVDVSSKLEDIKKLKVRNFNWKPDYYPQKSKKKMIGFIAQEVEEIFPALVSEHDIAPDGKDPVMKKAIKQAWSPIIIKALQEAIAKIETLETKVAALEAA